MDPERALQELARPEAFAGLKGLERPPARPVETIQTHISLLFLTRDRVYKVKKPVDLGFLDFSTREAREEDCRDEVELNRPLAPGVYLGVLPVTEGPEGRLRFGGEGEPVDWAVEMRRLPEARMLDVLLASENQEAVTPGMMESLAGHMADFHEATTVHPEAGSHERVRETILGNLHECAEHVGRTLTERLHRFLLDRSDGLLQDLRPVLRQRMRAGRIRDTHGDLHSEHVCFADPVVVYDRLEFSPALRRTDVAAEVAFLAMDLDHRGRRDLSLAWVESYEDRTQDRLPGGLLAVYEGYRAAVRGKVLSIKAENPEVPADEREASVEKARDYFALAAGYLLREDFPRVLVCMGPIASGKSAVAGWLAHRLGARWLRSDVERKALAGLEPTDRPGPRERAELYSDSMTERTYARLRERAAEAAGEGSRVVLDATYRSRAEREALRRALDSVNSPVFLHLQAPREILEERLRARSGRPTVSDARADLLPDHLASWELPGQDEPDVLALDAGRPLGETRAAALDALLDATPDMIRS